MPLLRAPCMSYCRFFQNSLNSFKRWEAVPNTWMCRCSVRGLVAAVTCCYVHTVLLKLLDFVLNCTLLEERLYDTRCSQPMLLKYLEYDRVSQELINRNGLRKGVPVSEQGKETLVWFKYFFFLKTEVKWVLNFSRCVYVQGYHVQKKKTTKTKT